MHDDVTLPFDNQQPGAADMPAPRNAWGDFRLIARVGYGGFGEVYRAWDPNLEREIALKLLLPGGAGTAQSDAEYKAMLREARALASVRHPNIVPIYGIDRHDGRVGFWTDFVKGKTLSVLLGAQGPFGYREATLIGLDVARALSAVHRAGILHRDIKAENVMREEGGRILLMDFGLSTLPHGQTNTAGTPNYMAPELWQGNAATVETDIYAMGVLLYYLVTGEYPVRLGGLTAREATEAIAKRRPLMDLRSDLPESFLRTVSTAMETDPAKRFSSAGQLAAALSECLGTAAPVEASTAPVPGSGRKQRSLPARLTIAAAVILGLAAFRMPAVRQWLHLEKAPVAAGISSNENDQYLKAQDLLKKSYKDANVAEAVTIFSQILKENPKFVLAQAGLGAAYFAQYRNSRDGKLLDLAKDTTDKALGMQPDLAPALATRARIEAATGHQDLALKDATDAKNADPRSPEALAALAEAYNALGKTPEAIDEIQSAIAIDDGNSMLPVRLGNYYLSEGKLQDAAAQWQNAIQIDPQNIFALFDLGVVNIRLNKLTEARDDFEKVLKFGPDAESYLALGSISLLEGKYDDAIGMDKKALAMDPSSQQAWANLGSAYSWSGDRRSEELQAYNKAIEIAEKTRIETPEDALLLAELADYYASIGNEEKSVPLARKSLTLSPNDPSVLYYCGDAYELLGERTRAIPLFAKALALGFRVNEFQRSPELASLRRDPGFERALQQAKQQSAVDSEKKMN
jgi:serine/threonine protein kinase/predicted Zn-dependent protease